MIAQTLGHFALGHHDATDFEEYVRQRVAANYFAGALLAPEASVVKLLTESKAAEDISVEDVNELFYVSYEMAAHRITNLITHHFGIPIHFIRSDGDGRVWKAYENDGVPLPSAADGTVEGQQTCRWWGSRQAFGSEDAYALHYQYTETASGMFWCATHRNTDRFRRRDHRRHHRRTRALLPWLRDHPENAVALSRPLVLLRACRGTKAQVGWCGRGVGARNRSQFVSGLPTDTVVFSADPGVDVFEVYAFLDRHQAN